MIHTITIHVLQTTIIIVVGRLSCDCSFWSHAKPQYVHDIVTMNVHCIIIHCTCTSTIVIKIPMYIIIWVATTLHDTPDHCTVYTAIGSHVTVPFDHMPSTYMYVQVYMNGICNSEKFTKSQLVFVAQTHNNTLWSKDTDLYNYKCRLWTANPTGICSKHRFTY